MRFTIMRMRRFQLDKKGVLDEPLDFILLVVGSIVIFSVLWFVLDQGKTTAQKESAELLDRSAHMEHEVFVWREDVHSGKLLRPYNRLENDLKVIANTGILPGEDPLSVRDVRSGFKS